MKKKTNIILPAMLSFILLVGCSSANTEVFEKESQNTSAEKNISKTELTEMVNSTETNQEQRSETKEAPEKSSVSSKKDTQMTESKLNQTSNSKGAANQTNSATSAATVKTSQATTTATAATTKTVNTTTTATSRTANTTTTTTQSTTTAAPQPETIKVSLSVDCINAFNAGNEIAQAISNNGYIYGPTVFEMEENATVLDLLYASGLTVSTTQGALGTYIVAIQSLAEFAVDGQGGWVCFVNGVMPNMATNKYILQPGDIVEFRYTVKSGDV